MGIFESVPELPEFNPEKFKLSNNILVLSDSQDLIQTLLGYFKDTDMVLMMGSSSEKYPNNVPDRYIYDDYDSSVAYNAVIRQKSLENLGRKSQLLMIIDNCNQLVFHDYKEHLSQETITNLLIHDPTPSGLIMDNKTLGKFDYIVLGRTDSMIMPFDNPDVKNFFGTNCPFDSYYDSFLNLFFDTKEELEDTYEHYITDNSAIIIDMKNIDDENRSVLSFDSVITNPKIGPKWCWQGEHKNNMPVD